ncbi:MAG: DUF4118 domain-containing protein [Firmicutes bacterium]|nr:DUF4118 domain-containing protein [Bacillota bacterium]
MSQKKYKAYKAIVKDKAKQQRKKRQRFSQEDLFFSVVVFLAVTIVSFIFNQRGSDPTLNIAMLYTLGIFIIASYTEGYFYGIIFSFMAMLSVNLFFTYPFGFFNFTLEGYQLTFIGMIVIGTITSVMSTNMKEQSRVLVEQERELARKEKELMETEKEKMRANLLRAVSHDLRTPLTGIIGSSDSYLEMEDKLSAEEKRELIEYVNKDANWLLNMVENLLTVTRIDNQSAKVTKELEVVDEVAAAAVIQFKKRFPKTEIHVKVADQDAMVMMDAILIQQVILNILQNAQIHACSEKPLELYIEETPEEVLFRIRDYGVGIDENRLETIFDGGGFRDEKVNADGYKGMGIGLSICKTIVLAHDGKITAKNHPEGAEFIFSLPKEMRE